MLKFFVVFVFPLLVESFFVENVNKEWVHFKQKYNKTYTCHEEEKYRFSVFSDTLKTIMIHNEAADKGESTYWMGINQFADLTDNEFRGQYTGLKVRSDKTSQAENMEGNLNWTRIPSEMDWRKSGCVTKVKSQGVCESCYAFATTGALEGQTCRKNGKLVSLSEQNILDCSETFKNEGCKGGHLDSSFQYVKDNGGIDTEASYPYEARVGKCKFNKANIGAEVKAYREIKKGCESQLQVIIARLGPVAVCIDSKGLKHYRYGIYDGINKADGSKCSSTHVDHAMTAIGYGKSAVGDYWLLKNSWDESWGERGYMRLVRNQCNMCGIATRAYYPYV